jgi:hypothetical protein
MRSQMMHEIVTSTRRVARFKDVIVMAEAH